MPTTLTLDAPIEKGVLDLGRAIMVSFSVTVSGGYAAGGDTLDLTTLKLPVSRLPYDLQILPRSGWKAAYIPGTTLANGKVKFYGYTPTSATAGVIPMDELAAGAYPASLTGDTIDCVAIFQKNL